MVVLDDAEGLFQPQWFYDSLNGPEAGSTDSLHNHTAVPAARQLL